MNGKTGLRLCALLLACAAWTWLARRDGGREIHVDAGSRDDSGDGRSWSTAKREIQSAIDVARRGDVVLVAAGVYPPIRTGGKTVVVRGVAGPEQTIIDGGGKDRCATLSSRWSDVVQPRLFNDLQKAWFYYLPNMLPAMGGEPRPPRIPSRPRRRSALIGFTLRNGAATLGGGAFGGSLKDCVIERNYAELAGGGVWGSSLEACVIRSNRSNWMGGGAWGGSLTNCVLEANVAEFGGGVWGGALAACTVQRNIADVGGGAAAARMAGGIVSGNVGWKFASGVYGGWLEGCGVSGNRMKDPEAENVEIHGASITSVGARMDGAGRGACDVVK